VIELAAMLKEQTIQIGLSVVILAFLTSWITWFHVNMLMNRAKFTGTAFGLAQQFAAPMCCWDARICSA
jgi:hypothetical protein